MNYLLCRTFGEFMSQPAVVMGLMLLSIGIACAVLAKRIATFVCKTEDISPDNKVFVATKIVGLVLILVGFMSISIGVILSF
jgi:hypothetical protein